MTVSAFLRFLDLHGSLEYDFFLSYGAVLQQIPEILVKRFIADLDVVVQQTIDCSVQCVCYSYERWKAHFGFTAFDVTYMGRSIFMSWLID